jgi:hypothetical protein
MKDADNVTRRFRPQRLRFGFGLPVFGFGLPGFGFGLPVPGFGLPVPGFGLFVLPGRAAPIRAASARFSP